MRGGRPGFARDPARREPKARGTLYHRKSQRIGVQDRMWATGMRLVRKGIENGQKENIGANNGN